MECECIVHIWDSVCNIVPVSLSVCLSVCIPANVSVCLSVVCLSLFLSMPPCLSTVLVCLPVSLSVCLSVACSPYRILAWPLSHCWLA